MADLQANPQTADLEQQLARETNEAAMGQRMRYSPEVQAYIAEKQAAQSQDYRNVEFQRAQMMRGTQGTGMGIQYR